MDIEERKRRYPLRDELMAFRRELGSMRTDHEPPLLELYTKLFRLLDTKADILSDVLHILQVERQRAVEAASVYKDINPRADMIIEQTKTALDEATRLKEHWNRFVENVRQAYPDRELRDIVVMLGVPV